MDRLLMYLRRAVNPFLTLLFSLTVWAGTMTGNGGGLNESSLIYAGLNYGKFVTLCKTQATCASVDLAGDLAALDVCRRGLPSTMNFSVPADMPALRGRPFVIDAQSVTYNREVLYADPEQTGIGFAFGFLTRVLLNHCTGLDFARTRPLVKGIEDFFDHVRDQLTVGTSRVALPRSEWIVLRSGFNDILLEDSATLRRISCAHTLDDCTVSDLVGAKIRFESLSLADEKLEADKVTVHFALEGLAYLSDTGLPKNFRLEVTAVKGVIKKLVWQGRDLPCTRFPLQKRRRI